MMNIEYERSRVQQVVPRQIPRQTIALVLVALLMTCVSCQNGQEKSSSKNNKTPDSRTKEGKSKEPDVPTIIELVQQLGGKIETDETDASRITLIDFSNCHSVDADTVRQLGRITSLKSLFLLDTGFEEEGLVYLSNFPNLENLDLKGSKITDQGLSQLPPLKQLCFLGLSGSQVTDAGIMKLTELSLPKLRFLQLNFTDISDDAKQQLTEKMPDLKIVL